MLLLGGLFAAALAIRVAGIAQPPFDFHPTRQFRSAIIARGFYFETNEGIPTWRREVAAVAGRQEGVLEPPIMEHLAAVLYRVAGEEHLWLPRLCAAAFWLIGGAALHAIARKLASANAAVVAVAFYLFLPFGVLASRSFQPEPLMVMGLLLSLLTILEDDARPSPRSAMTAGSVAGIAFLIKPLCVFATLAAFAGLAVRRRRHLREPIGAHVVLYALCGFGPTAAFYGYGVLFGDSLRTQAQESFFPSLLLSAYFWRSWLEQIGSVVGYTAFAAGAAGTVLCADGRARAFTGGLWLGYGVFGLVFNYHVHSHDYYQLQFIPIVALSLGLATDVAIAALSGWGRQWLRRVLAWAALCLACALGAVSYFTQHAREEFDWAKEIRVARQIGQAVGHSMRTVMLVPWYGKPLQYYGELSGWWWPRGGDFNLEAMQGGRVLSAEERLRAFEAGGGVDYFIVSDRNELERQEDLRRLLGSSVRVLTETPDFVVFDLRNGFDGRRSSAADAQGR